MERSVYRIIDANFNRARESLRVMEDFCRYSLNNAELSRRAKEMRHILSSLISRLGSERLLSSRDTLADVGLNHKVKQELHRLDLLDSLTAAGKRLTEALRVISEVTQPINSEVSGAIEQLRYSVYTFEKNVFVQSLPLEKFKKVSLYVIITSDLPADILSLTGKCIAGGADCIQLRSKDILSDTLFSVAVEFVQLCRSQGVLSIINDRPDIAAASGADGLHLGQHDMPIDRARHLQLTPLIIGKSTHSIEELNGACSEGATYVSLGPVFPTRTKPDTQPVGLEYIEQGLKVLSDKPTEAVAIGGITLRNLGQVLSTGIKRISVCSAVAQAEDPSLVCERFREQINSFDSD